MTIEVIDLPAHRARCERCQRVKLCEVGRRLAEAQATAMLEVAYGNWQIKAKA